MCRCGAVVTASGNAAPYREAGQRARLMMPDRSFLGGRYLLRQRRRNSRSAPAPRELPRVAKAGSGDRSRTARNHDSASETRQNGVRGPLGTALPRSAVIGRERTACRGSRLRQRWGVRWGVCRFENPAEIQRLTFATASERGPSPNPIAELEFLEMRGLGRP